MLDSISINDLKNIDDAQIIDIRSIEKYNNGHIMNAKNIPFEQLLMYHFKYLNKNCKYYIYCQKGNKSRHLCSILKNEGYNIINIIGGYEAWIMNR